jgi:pimeloyl-ACP methyl ester carboxylesterase
MTIALNILMMTGIVILLVIAITLIRYAVWKNARVSQLNADSEIIQTANGPVEYRWWGDGDTVMLYIHGTPGGYDQYVPRETHTAESARVLTLSRPGYLNTPVDTGRSAEDQADACAALLDALDIQKVIVVAASGGGPSGITFAAKYPERTIGLITIAAVSQAMSLESEETAPAAASLLQSDFVNWLSLVLLPDQRLVRMIVSGEHNQQRILDDPAKLALLKRMVRSSQPPSLRQTGVDNDAAELPVLNLPLQQITVPTLIIHGTADRNVPFSFSEQFAQHVPHARLAALEGADHFMSVSHQEEFNEHVDGFVASLLR